jgi:hypothetical protein
MSVLAPTGELLSFAWPKESNQRKGHPTAACILRSEAFTGGWQKGLPAPLPTCRIYGLLSNCKPSIIKINALTEIKIAAIYSVS